MDNEYKEVYIDINNSGIKDNEIEVNPEYVYLTIPSDWVCIYHKLLGYLADFGEAAIKDCQSACKGKNLYVIQCWNMFQSAIACRALGDEDKANLFIKYITAQLDNIYNSSEVQQYSGEFMAPITEDGDVIARITCGQGQIHFYVNGEDGELYEEHINKDGINKVYQISDDNELEEIIES